MSGWVPITERLPEPHKYVLVYLWGNVPYIAYTDENGEWNTDDFTIDFDEVPAYWMPLPEPPEDGK